ncbi:hypothetical protein [Thermosipho atlanticus]|uniref:Uncharacterized protein n=1 Tax=Thermosipho atlanticus DSM 15807 TaxID=1123380 RepID=A0A1M5R369_9BACT|nr:hypothetical protein [Thermosipho atlanticus]SHH20782.1 hypothetical protein SAMN02745199_0311 [Thermosipho atlanticus DSM 15807]
MYLNQKICTKCGGKCCKYFPGIALPKDFGNSKEEIFKNLSIALKSGKWCIDWIDRNKNLYYVRPSIKGKEGILFDNSISGKCTFLTDKGCNLIPNNRPTGCLLLEPIEFGNCIPHLDRFEAAKQWKQYLEILFNAAIEAEKVDIEF